MPEEVKLWQVVEGDNLQEMRRDKLNLEERIEAWVERDPSIVSDDLLIIGRQVQTDYGGIIDLLCLDRNGDLVILELKRDKTPREITAQALDYASWVKDLSNEQIVEIAEKYFKEDDTLEEAFSKRFKSELPDSLNNNHNMLIIASEIDSSSERIMNYLSDTYGVGINAVTFNYFKGDGDREYLARTFLIEPSQVEYKTKTKSTSKRKRNLTHEELQQMAAEHGVSDLYRKLVEGMGGVFTWVNTTKSSVTFRGRIEDSSVTILSLIPAESSEEAGVRYQVYIPRLAKYLGIGEDQATELLPKNRESYEYHKNAPHDLTGYTGYFGSEDIDQFVQSMKQTKASSGA